MMQSLGMRRCLVVGALALLPLGCSEKTAGESVGSPTVQGDVVQFRSDSPQRKVFVSQPAEVESSRVLAVSGRLVWDETATTRVIAPLAGRITRLEAKPGDVVRAGQVLARMASPDFGQAQSEARAAGAAAALAQKNAARARELGEAGVTARRDVEAAEAELARANAERDRTQARLVGYGGGGDAHQSFALASPVAGVVVERNANVGQEFRPDQAGPGTPPLFVVTDPARLWVNLEAPEAAMGMVKVGTPVELHVDAAGVGSIKTVVDYVPDSLDPVTRTLRMRAAVPNASRALKAEVFVRGTFLLPGSGAPLVPASAVLLIQGRHVLFVDAGDGRYERRLVKAEDAGVERMRVVEGVKPDERVVTEGALFLQQILASVKRS